MPYPTVIVTGDSIAQMSFKAGGYGSALVDLYQGNYDVLNRGMGGYNSTQLLQRFQDGLDVPTGADVRLIVIHIGTNDCVETGFQKVSAEGYRSNLHSIISHIRSTYPGAVTVLLTPSTVEGETILALEETVGMPERFRSIRTPERAKEIAEVCKEVAREEKLDCFDVFAMHEGKKDIFTDGLHYNAEGYKPICDALLELIQTKYPDLVPSEFPQAFPPFMTYGRDGDEKAQEFAREVVKIGERMKAKANGVNGHSQLEDVEA